MTNKKHGFTTFLFLYEQTTFKIENPFQQSNVNLHF